MLWRCLLISVYRAKCLQRNTADIRWLGHSRFVIINVIIHFDKMNQWKYLLPTIVKSQSNLNWSTFPTPWLIVMNDICVYILHLYLSPDKKFHPWSPTYNIHWYISAGCSQMVHRPPQPAPVNTYSAIILQISIELQTFCCFSHELLIACWRAMLLTDDGFIIILN